MDGETVFVIKPGGKVRIEGHGYTGSECKDVAKVYEDGLGIVESDTLKDEYHMKAEEKNAQELRRG